MKPFSYLQEIVKLPGIRGVYIFDEKGEEIFKESTFELKKKSYFTNLIKYFLTPDKKLPDLIYFFSGAHLVIIGKNPLHFKGIIMTVSLKNINLGLLRVYIKKFLKFSDARGPQDL